MGSSPAGIPGFDLHGNLPDGVYPCDETTLRARFVAEFPSSQTRQANHDGFMRLRRDAEQHGIIGTQWVDGSFVTSKADPADVDLVTFCDLDHLNSLPASAQSFVHTCINGREAARAKYETHTFLIPCCDTSHPFYPAFEKARAYWRKWFGKTRDIPNPPGPDLPGHPKGFLQMPLGDAAKAPVVRTERGQT